MSVLSEIRRLPGVIKDLSTVIGMVGESLDLLVELQGQNGPADERLQELERTRAMWEAEMEAKLLKADSTLKSAANAEARSRTMLRNAEKIADPFAEEGDEVEAAVPSGHDPRVEEEPMLAMPVGLAPNNKAHALRAKWMT